MPLRISTDVHIVGEATLGFISQIALFHRALRRLYTPQDPIRIRCFLGGAPFDWDGAPLHVRNVRDDIEIVMADPADYAARGLYAQCDDSYLNVRPEAEAVIFADADTVWLRRFDALIEIVKLNRAVAGCIAHFTPPDGQEAPVPYWKELFERHGVTAENDATALPYTCTLDPSQPSPFNVNFGFAVWDAAILKAHGAASVRLTNALRENMNNPYFCYQVGLPILLRQIGAQTIALPVSYNYPNDDLMLDLYAFDLDEIYVLHYLRESKTLHRQTSFCSEEAFSRFMESPLSGTNATLAAAFKELRVLDWFSE